MSGGRGTIFNARDLLQIDIARRRRKERGRRQLGEAGGAWCCQDKAGGVTLPWERSMSVTGLDPKWGRRRGFATELASQSVLDRRSCFT
jgi:hypothetical protein